MKILICGSRGWHDAEPIETVLAGYDVISEGMNQRLTVIQGGARGADALAKSLATQSGFDVVTVPADWDKHGKAAGPIRNQQMLDEQEPDVVWAFRSSGKSNGTDDMIKRSVMRNIPTYVVTQAGEQNGPDV